MADIAISPEERGIIEALKRRDAYGIVVARVMEWYDSYSRVPFEPEYPEIMREAGLMDEEYELTTLAVELVKKGL